MALRLLKQQQKIDDLKSRLSSEKQKLIEMMEKTGRCAQVVLHQEQFLRIEIQKDYGVFSIPKLVITPLMEADQAQHLLQA